MAKNIPANATETSNVPSSGGRSKSVDFGNNSQSGSNMGGGMGADESFSRIPCSGRGNNPINPPSMRGGFKGSGPDSVKFGGF